MHRTATLLPGQAATFTATYTVTQADLDNGSVNDSATATGTPPTGPPITSPPSTAAVPPTQSPALTVASPPPPPAATTVGRSITYKFVATNTGNVTLTRSAVTDTQTRPGRAPRHRPDLSGLTTGRLLGPPPPGPASRPPSPPPTRVTQADLDNGSSPTPPPPPAPRRPAARSPRRPSTVTVPAAQIAGITVAKSVTSTAPLPPSARRSPTSFVVTNTGNVTLTG